MNLLLCVLLVPFVGAFLLLFVPSWNEKLIRRTALNISSFNFLLSLLLWIQFDNSTGKFQFFQSFGFVDLPPLGKSFELPDADKTNSALSTSLYEQSSQHNSLDLLRTQSNQGIVDPFSVGEISTPFDVSHSILNFVIGIDGVSLFFIILTTLLTPICILVGWKSIQSYVKEYCIAFLVLESLMIAVFSVLDLLLFYVFFESVLIPMFLIIGVWGSRARKIRAAYQFFLYTLFGSVLMLLGILLIYFQTGSLDLSVLYTTKFSESREILLWLAFFASFAVKVPMLPVHIWLPEAHVEAPTAGSVILAGILLKLGTYGFLRFSIPLFPYASIYFTPLIYTMSVIAIVYTSLTTLRQVDLKKIIAYSSVAHMNFVTIGLFSLNAQGVEGSVMLMLSHGLVSPALFLLVGILYDRHKTRLLKYYAGCGRTMPIFAILFLFFTMANISLPGTSSFIGEFLVLVGAFQSNTFVAVLTTSGIVFGAAYALWLCNRILYGFGKVYYINTFADLSRREFALFVPIIIGVLWIGLNPEPFLDTLHFSVANIINHPAI